MPSTITPDDAVDDAGDGAVGVAALQPVSPVVTLDSIMELLVSLKEEVDAMKAKSDLIAPADTTASVTIEITCRPTAITTIPIATIPVAPSPVTSPAAP